MRIPDYRGEAGQKGGHVLGQGERNEGPPRVLFFSRSRADLGLTLWLAAALIVSTLVLFQLDDGNVQLVEYNRHMREATCMVIDAQLQHVEVPREGLPPDIELPGQDKWRGALRVHVITDDRSESFNATAHATLVGKWSDQRQFEEQFLMNHPVHSSETCYYGPSGVGGTGVVFNLMAALSDREDEGNVLGVKGSANFGLHVAKLVVAFFALLFTGLVIVKLVAGTWDSPPEERIDYTQIKAGRESADNTRTLVRGGLPELHGTLEDGPSGTGRGRILDLQGGLPRDFEDVPLGRRS